MDLLGLIYDHDYFIFRIDGASSNLSWGDGIDLFRQDYIKECFPPNEVFAGIPEGLLYETEADKKGCLLIRDWLVTYNHENFNNSFKIYLSLDKSSLEYKVKLAKKNLLELAQYYFQDLESVVYLENELQSFIIRSLENSTQVVSERTVTYLSEHFKKYDQDTQQSCIKMIESSVKVKLIEYLANPADKAIKDFNNLQKSIYVLREEIGTLSFGLVKGIFGALSVNPKVFNEIAVDMLAEDKNLPKHVLEPLLPIIHQIGNDVVFAFIGLRLVQNNLDPDGETLKRFESLFENDDETLLTYSIDFFYKLAKRSPDLINERCLQNIIKIIPRLSEQQFAKVKEIFDYADYYDKNEYDSSIDQVSHSKSENVINTQTDVDELKTVIGLVNSKHAELLKIVVNKLIDLKWQPKILKEFINKVIPENNLQLTKLIFLLEKIFINKVIPENNSQFTKLIFLLEEISDYKITPELVDRSGFSIATILSSNKSIDEIVRSVNRAIQDNKFSVAKDVKTLLNEITKANEKNTILNYVRDGFFKNTLEEISRVRNYDLANKYDHIEIKKNLTDWGSYELQEWRKTIFSVNDSNIAEVMAVIMHAAHISLLNKESYPYEIQVIAVLSLYKSCNGGLAQIATGEGKSLIISIFAILSVLNGRQVDIVTSAKVLAVRDAITHEKIYSKLGITVSHNIYAKYGVAECYSADIVYGDMLHFVGDSLKDLFENVKRGRSHDLLIVDEVDGLFIDQNSMKVQLSAPIPGLEYLTQVLIYMWGTFISHVSMVESVGNKCILKIEKNTKLQDHRSDDLQELLSSQKALPESIVIDKSCSEVLHEQILSFVHKVLFSLDQEVREKRNVILPTHLTEFAQEQVEHWASSINLALTYREKHDYIIYNSSDKSQARYEFKTVAPVDYKNTGVIQPGIHWSDGLHQFLQIKHNITIFPETLINNYESYLGFFNRYNGSIYGVSGTLGTSLYHKFLQKEYGVDINVIPTFIEKDFYEFEPLLETDENSWKKQILSVLIRKIQNLRACLIVLPTIKQVEDMYNFIKSGYDNSHIFLYGTSTSEENDVVKRELLPGDVIVSTNLGGRGTDFKLTKEVKRNGGLHIIIADYPDNIRVDHQAFGRSARQGQPGSGQIILKLDEESAFCQTFECLVQYRESKESIRLEHDSICQIPYLNLKDELYKKFVGLLRDGNSPTGYRITLNKQDESGNANLFLEDGRIFCQIDAKSRNNQAINFNDEIRTIDPKSEYHIKTVLKQSVVFHTSLNHQDFEIINFLIATHIMSSKSIILHRVEKAYEELVKKHHSETEFLNYLLTFDKNFDDLKLWNNDQISMVKLREKYLLWIKDRQVYTNKFEIAQVTDYWGIWLKEFDSNLAKNEECKSFTNEEKIKAQINFEKVRDQAFKNFSDFYKELSSLSAKNEIMKNPARLVQKAIHYTSIASEHNDYSDQFGANIFNSIKKGWEYLASFFGTESVINFGKENYLIKNPLEMAAKFIEKAIEIDNIYSWQAHNAKSLVTLVKDGKLTARSESEQANVVKQQFFESTRNAIERIMDIIIPSYQTQITFLSVHNQISKSSDLMIQLIGSIKLYESIVEVLQQNIEVIRKSSSEQMIRVSKATDLDQLANSINVTESVLKHFNISDKESRTSVFQDLKFTSKQMLVDQITSSGGLVFSIEAYDLSDDRDWTGTFLAAAIGCISIAAGFALLVAFPGAGVFVSSFAISLITGGIGDIISAVQSVAQDIPIDQANFLQSKAISIGISLAVSGALSFASNYDCFKSINTIAETGISFKDSPITSMLGATAFQMAAKVTSYALGKLSNQIIERDMNKIQRETKEKIDQLLLDYRGSLDRIYASDEFIGDNKNILQKSLRKGFIDITADYRSRFSSDERTFIEGTAHGTASKIASTYDPITGLIVDAGKAAIDTSLGYIKAKEAADKIVEKSKDIILQHQDRAFKSGKMLAIRLEKDFVEAGRNISQALKEQQFITSDENLKFADCNELKKVTLAENLKKYNVTNVCMFVTSFFDKDHSSDISELSEFVTSLVSNTIASIKKSDIAQPLEDLAIGTIVTLGNYAIEEIKKSAKNGNKHQEEQLDPEKAASDSGYLDNNIDDSSEQDNESDGVCGADCSDEESSQENTKKHQDTKKASNNKPQTKEQDKIENSDLDKQESTLATPLEKEVCGYESAQAEKLSTKETLIKAAAEQLVTGLNIISEHPDLAQFVEYGATAANIGINTLLGGPVGFVKAIIGEAASRTVIGPVVDEIIVKTANHIQETCPYLDKRESEALAIATVMLVSSAGSKIHNYIIKSYKPQVAHIDNDKMSGLGHKIDADNNFLTNEQSNHIWSAGKPQYPVKNAYEHWGKHKQDFPSYNNALDYVKGTKEFLDHPPTTALTKIRLNGDKIVYDPVSEVMAIASKDGTPKTMFKPVPKVKHQYNTNMEYFNAQ